MTDFLSPVTLPETQTGMLQSKIVGSEFQISISLPFGYSQTDKAYPVLYIVDANMAFGSATEIVRTGSQGEYELPEMIVVGIGYDLKDPKEFSALRYRDLTPTETSAEEYEARRKNNPNMPAFRGTGGAGKFLSFICEELMPVINSKYRTLPMDSTLWGDSLGGLFVLYVLFHNPQAFQRYIIGSPSIWWDHEITFQFEQRYAETYTDLPAKIFLMVGGREELAHIPEMVAVGMVRNTCKINDLLQSRHYPNLDLTFHIFDGETHSSVITMGIARGLRVVHRDSVRGIEAYFEDQKKLA